VDPASQCGGGHPASGGSQGHQTGRPHGDHLGPRQCGHPGGPDALGPPTRGTGSLSGACVRRISGACAEGAGQKGHRHTPEGFGYKESAKFTSVPSAICYKLESKGAKGKSFHLNLM